MSSGQCGAEVCTLGGTDIFQELLERLRDSHNTTVQELQFRVNKLKHERCFDAQKLEEFYKKNQNLREQQRTLQDSIKVLKERLQSGPCDRCRDTEKQMKKTQTAFENFPLFNELKSERDVLKEENKKLRLQLKQLKGQIFQQTTLSEPEEGMIPDSPKQPLSFPVVNKMKRKREQSHVRYAEKLLSHSLPEQHKRKAATSLDFHARTVLVPETCDLDASYISKSHAKNSQTVVAESCHKDLNSEQMPESDVNSKNFISQPKQDERNLPCCLWAREQNITKNHDWTSFSQTQSSKQVEQDSIKRRSWESKQAVADALSIPPKNYLPSQNCGPNDESWSLDPEAALTHYGTSILSHPELKIQTETVELDCTFVSHSLLVAHHKKSDLDQTNSITGIGHKANDSLANIFDNTQHEDYESCPQDETSTIKKKCVSDDEEEGLKEGIEQDEQMKKTKFKDEEEPAGDANSAKNKSVACVVVVRKKAERRKLHGHTCKECEIYYAHLPEEERKKKLLSCSRHRFRYIPPSTPENFWDVGFPSTQTCIERGYIKEENQADVHLMRRRRRPYQATFSPKFKAKK